MKIRHGVFWPPFLMLFAALALNFLDSALFLSVVNGANGWLLNTFSSAFAWCGLFCLGVCFLVGLSPFGRETIGGKGATPLFSYRSWICVSICTSTAAGILFWGMAEPITHLVRPPTSLGIAAGSDAAARFAMSTLFMHWSFIPCAIYAMPALMFAIAFYNLKQPFSLSSVFVPLVGARLQRRLSTPVDALALYTLVLGMAASLATGVLAISGGLSYLFGIEGGPFLWTVIGVAIVISYIASALSGVEKGIKNLSILNSGFFIGLAIYVLIFGAPLEAAKITGTGLEDFFTHFIARSLFTELAPTDPWPRQWTVFYWAVWLAWAPVTAGFLGRIGRGYTVRQFLTVNLLVPAVFAMLWMAIFGGTALSLELFHGAGLSEVLANKGPEGMTYGVLSGLPMAGMVIPFFILVTAISYITAADSNTLCMAAMSSTGISAEEPDPPRYLKLIWGSVVGVISLVMLVHCGVDGIRNLSYLGGLPALFFVFGTGLSLLVMAWGPSVRALFSIGHYKEVEA